MSTTGLTSKRNDGMIIREIILSVMLAAFIPIFVHIAAGTFIPEAAIGRRIADKYGDPHKFASLVEIKLEADLQELAEKERQGKLTTENHIEIARMYDQLRSMQRIRQDQERVKCDKERKEALEKSFRDNLLFLGIVVGIISVVIGLIFYKSITSVGFVLGGSSILLYLCIVLWATMPLWLKLLVISIILTALYLMWRNASKISPIETCLNDAVKATSLHAEEIQDDLKWEVVLRPILSCTYFLSFILPSAGGGNGMFSGPIFGYQACMMSLGSFPIIPFFLAGLGNIWMLMAMVSLKEVRKSQLVSVGLTIQAIVAVGLLFLSSGGFLIGYYCWMFSQVGMCLLLWFGDSKPDGASKLSTVQRGTK